MTKRNDHTFAICAYKESPYLEECILSLKNQTVKSNIIMATSTPNEWIQGLAEKYEIPLYINTGEGGIAQDFGLPHAHGYQLQEKVLAVGQVAQALPCGGNDGNAQVHHGLAEAEPVAHVTAAAGNIVDYNGIELSGLGIFDHALEAAPVCIGAAASFVLVGGHNLNAVGIAVFPYFPELICNAVLVLPVSAVPAIFCCFHLKNYTSFFLVCMLE